MEGAVEIMLGRRMDKDRACARLVEEDRGEDVIISWAETIHSCS